MSRIFGMTDAQIAGQKALAAATNPRAGRWVLNCNDNGLPISISRGGVKVLDLSYGYRNRHCAEYVVTLLNSTIKD